jgi:hypothetical protein
MQGIRLLGLLALTFSIVCPAYLYAAAITPAPGDLIITEVMADPYAVSDTKGEWFEVYNLSENILDLNGLILSDNGTNKHKINNGGSLLLNPFDYMVFGKSSNISSDDYVPDYVYSGFYLGNDDDEIIISTAGAELLRLEYGDGFAVSGKSRELAGTVGFPPDATDYVLGTTEYGSGDFGTPGGANASSWMVVAQPVPVPGAIWLLGSGLVGLLGVVGRRS